MLIELGDTDDIVYNLICLCGRSVLSLFCLVNAEREETRYWCPVPQTVHSNEGSDPSVFPSPASRSHP